MSDQRKHGNKTLIVIRSAESSFVYDSNTSTYMPPVGTKNASYSATSETSGTAANCTPVIAAFEVIGGKARLEFTDDNDNQEFEDVGDRTVQQYPGLFKGSGTLEVKQTKGTARMNGCTRQWNPTTRTYTRVDDCYPKFDIWVLDHPDSMNTSASSADMLTKYSNVTFGNTGISIDPGQLTKVSLPFMYESAQELMSWTADTLTLYANTGVSGHESITLTTQPTNETRLVLTPTDFSGSGSVTITGMAYFSSSYSNSVVETLTFSNSTPQTTASKFQYVSANGIVIGSNIACSLAITAESGGIS